jgi:hypothetical protein
MPDERNPKGWQELEGLARRPAVANLVVVDLREASAMLVLQNGRASIARAAQAADGEYELQRAGRLVVRQGRLAEIVGSPEASALTKPSP